MTQDQWILIIAGSVIAVLGTTGLMTVVTRRKFVLRLLGDVGTRIFYTVLGILFVVLGLLNITG
jgi:threonine/homoserine/homoserine lactone efflux protein